MKGIAIGILIINLFSFVTCNKDPEPDPNDPNPPTTQLDPTLALQFEKKESFGVSHIVFTADGRAAALNGGRILFSDNNGSTWQTVRQYGSDSAIQSVALHPTENIIFAGARFGHNFNNYTRQLITKKVNGVWENPAIISSKYTNDQGGGGFITFNYNHSFWFRDFVINCYTNTNGTDGFIALQTDVTNTDDPPSQIVKASQFDRTFIAKNVLPVHDAGIDVYFNVSGYEYARNMNSTMHSRIHTLKSFSWGEWETYNTTDNHNKPQCCLPDYMCASPALSNQNFNKLFLYKGIRKLYRSNVKTAAYHQQEIILPSSQFGANELQCVGIDNQGYVWISVQGIGLFKSTTIL